MANAGPNKTIVIPHLMRNPLEFNVQVDERCTNVDGLDRDRAPPAASAGRSTSFAGGSGGARHALSLQ